MINKGKRFVSCVAGGDMHSTRGATNHALFALVGNIKSKKDIHHAKSVLMVLFLPTIDEKNQRSMTPRMTAIFVKVAPFQRMGRVSACFALLVKKPSSMHRTTIGHFARIV